MAGMLSDLINILKEQTKRFEELKGLALEKKEIIVKNEIEELQKITNLESIIVTQTNRLEKKRIAITNDIAMVLGKQGEELDLKTLEELLPNQPEKSELAKVGKKLRKVIQELKEVNELNNSLIQNALEFIEYSLNVIRSTAEPEVPGFDIGIPQGSIDIKM